MINELKQQGIAVKEGMVSPELLTVLLEYYKTLTPIPNKYKPFLNDFWDRRVALDMNNPFHQFALSDDVLSIAKEYLGETAHLHDSSLYESKVVKDDAERLISQRWHRDPECDTIIKVFIYLTDVDDDGSGPFFYVRESQPNGKYADVLHTRDARGALYPKFGEVEEQLPEEQVLKVLGKAGTVIFADTIGLHRGGYCTKQNRLMYTATYVKDRTRNGLWSYYEDEHNYTL